MKPYFSERVETADTRHDTFAPGDRVRALPSSPKFPPVTGTILYLKVGNRGKGRVWAFIKIDGDGHTLSFPVGALRLI